MNISQPYENVFEALEDDRASAENLRIRTEIMIRLRNYINQEVADYEEAARRMGVTISCVNDLINGKIEHFTVDLLLNMLFNIGIRAELILKHAA